MTRDKKVHIRLRYRQRACVTAKLGAKDVGKRNASFIHRRERITFGLLGVGAGGHVASLFNASDITRSEGEYAIAVPCRSGPDRVSVTADLLNRAERRLFLVTGREKVEFVKKVTSDPERALAAQAVKKVPGVEIWFALR